MTRRFEIPPDEVGIDALIGGADNPSGPGMAIKRGRMSEADCLAEIAAGTDAWEILRREMPSAKRRFTSVDNALRALLADVREHFPDAEYYTASGGFTLMLGKPHSAGVNMRPRPQLVALAGRACIGDGDF